MNAEEANSEISIYPNPSNGTFTIQSDQIAGSEMFVFDFSGKLIDRMNLNESKFIYDNQNLQNGLYSILIVTENKRFNQKISVLK